MADVAEFRITAKDETAAAFESMKKNVGDLIGGVGSLQGAFATLAGVLAGGAFGVMIKSTIDSMNELHKLALQAGVTVDALSALKTVAKLSGTDLETVAGGLGKLSKSMLETVQGTGKATKAFSDLGLSVVDSSGQLKKSDDFMLEVAITLDGMSNKTQQVAYAQQIFGKSGAALLPMLHDLAEVGLGQAKVTAEQAEQAHQAEMSFAKLAGRSQAYKVIITGELLPALNDLLSTFLAATGGAGSLTETIKNMANDGTLASWARTGAESMAFLVDAVTGVKNAFVLWANVYVRIVGEIKFAAQAALLVIESVASRKWKGAEISAVLAERDAFVQAQKDEMASMLEKETFSDQLTRKIIDSQNREIDQALYGEEKVKNAYEVTTKAVKDKKDAYDQMANSLGKETAKLTAEIASLQTYGTSLVSTKEAEAAFMLTTVSRSDAEAKAILQSAKNVDSLVEMEKGLKANVEANKKHVEALAASVKAVEDRIDVEKRAIDTFGLSRDGVIAYDIAQLEEERNKKSGITGTETEIRTIDLKIQKLRELTGYVQQHEYLDELKKQHEQELKMWDEQVKSIDSMFRSGWDKMITTGRGSWEQMTHDLKDTFKKVVADEIYKMFVKPIVLNLVANAAGSMGLNGLANAATAAGGGSGGLGSLISTGSSLYSGLNSLSGGGGFLGSIIGSSGYAVGGQAATALTMGGTEAGAIAAGVGEGTGLLGMASGTGALGALGPIGLAIGGIALLASIFGGSGGRTKDETWLGGKVTNGVTAINGVPNAPLSGNSDAAGMTSLIQGMGSTYTSLAQSLGIGTVAGMGFSAGFEDNNMRITGGGGDYNQVVGGSGRDGPGIFNSMDIDRNDKAGIALGISRAILMGLKDSNLPDELKGIFNAAIPASMSKDAIDQLLSFAGAIKAVGDYVKADPMKAYTDSVATASNTLMGAWQKQGDAIKTLATNFDGSTTASRDLSTALGTRYQTELQLVAQIQGALQSTKAMFASDIQAIQYAQMSPDQQRTSLLTQEAQLKQQLGSATDPTQINDLATQLRNIINQEVSLAGGAGALSSSQAAGVIADLKGVSDLVSGQLTAAQKLVTDAHNVNLPDSIAKSISDAMAAAAKAYADAANTTNSAATTLSTAAGIIKANAGQGAIDTKAIVDAIGNLHEGVVVAVATGG